MLNKKLIVYLVAMLFFAACSSTPTPTSSPASQPDETGSLTTLIPSAPTQSATPTAAPENTSTPHPSSTPSKTATLTSTPTNTPSPTLSPTPTITPSPTLAMVLPGFYNVGGCVSKLLDQYGPLYTLCVVNVTVSQNREMTFNMTWELEKFYRSVNKHSDIGNKNMYITDNLGNRYDHIGGSGAAYRPVLMDLRIAYPGSFVFEKAPPGATTFTFHDDDYGMEIKGLSLSFPIVISEPLPLINLPFVLEYRKDLWELTKDDQGLEFLTHKKYSGCTLQNRAATSPQGNFKNKLAIAEIVYEIYGFIDNANNLGIREYYAVSGLNGLSDSVKPFFYVTIPLDNSQNCILGVSETLGTLSAQQP